MPTQKVENLNLYLENMHAFICKECNYIQLDMQNIHNHLRDEHEIKDSTKYKKYYEEVILLPAIKNLPFSFNPHFHGKLNHTIVFHMYFN